MTEMESETEHGAAKMPVAVQVNVYEPAGKVTVLVGDTITPPMSVH